MVPSAESAGAARSVTHATTRKSCIVCRLYRSAAFGNRSCPFKRFGVFSSLLLILSIFSTHSFFLSFLISTKHRLWSILNWWEWAPMQLQETEKATKNISPYPPLRASSTGVPRVIVRWELVDFCTGDPHQGKGVARADIWTIYCDLMFSSMRFCFYTFVLVSNEGMKIMKIVWRIIF